MPINTIQKECDDKSDWQPLLLLFIIRPMVFAAFFKSESTEVFEETYHDSM